MLLSKGADPNRVNDRGQSIIAGAVFKAHNEVVRLLKEAHADLHLGHPTAIQTATLFHRNDLLDAWGEQPATDVPSTIMPTPQASSAPQSAPSTAQDGPER